MPRSPILPPSGRRAAALFLLAGLSACATPGRGDLVFIDVDGDNSCFVEAAGRRFALPGGEAGLAAHLRRLAAQAGGFARIGYFSETPPPASVVG